MVLRLFKEAKLRPKTNYTFISRLNGLLQNNINSYGRRTTKKLCPLENSTLPKFNMERNNDGFQNESPITGCHVQVPC